MATSGNMLCDDGNSTSIMKYVEGTFTPTVTLVGGAGNTVPVYSTNTGRYTRIGNRVFAAVLLTGDGGAEGAGTGTVNIALPIAAGASQPAGQHVVGRMGNGSTVAIVTGEITGSASTISLNYFDTISTVTILAGDSQNSTARTIRLAFSYEV